VIVKVNYSCCYEEVNFKPEMQMGTPGNHYVTRWYEIHILEPQKKNGYIM